MSTWNTVNLAIHYWFVVSPATVSYNFFVIITVNFILKQCWPLDQNFCASGDDPSTCLWAAFGCKCEQWSPCVWLPLQAAGMWRCSSSSARRSAASWPVARPACTTGPTAPPLTGRSPCNRGTFILPISPGSPLQKTFLCNRQPLRGEHHLPSCKSWCWLYTRKPTFANVSG